MPLERGPYLPSKSHKPCSGRTHSGSSHGHIASGSQKVPVGMAASSLGTALGRKSREGPGQAAMAKAWTTQPLIPEAHPAPPQPPNLSVQLLPQMEAMTLPKVTWQAGKATQVRGRAGPESLVLSRGLKAQKMCSRSLAPRETVRSWLSPSSWGSAGTGGATGRGELEDPSPG